ncbi:FMN-binding protein [Limimaricola pyoseonensis]|uniref:Na(+)-translocating NADH-quinone reductase subunit C n=1 Tax=Limimaricola pyoseonensis TaxID=521013 RepID=A0A1G7JMH8_9RHOB|nr:FMN-binding protein [Limimaricola pyoseonensis]SDF25984.1 Na+-transporting NADH:ubiquinone oxidoreductase subunit C [Limimaricola pyoseonensis]
MAETRGIWGRFLDRPNEDPVKAIGMAGIVALCAALVLSTTAILLRPLQEAHLEAARAARMEEMLDTLPGLRDLMREAGVDALETRLVALSDGRFVAVGDGAMEPVPEAEDIAGLGERPAVVPVHLLERDGRLALVVLPVSGQGYQSRIEALLALEPDLNTVAALAITAQGETPGLGTRITEPDWLALWPGREIADETGAIRIAVTRGDATGPHEVDGISGATRTGNGVANMVRFWMGPWGYGPFLDRLREGAA